jgi:DNA primase|tara:strand:+ start:43 stop:1938 length:1896 start_codon:yes stop_codon:yes gene_type:complete
MIDNNIIEEIKERLDIVEVIGDFVSLKKSGSNYKALSPFTSEKTPSFFVSPSKQIFKCFSTGKGGDAIEFLREVDSMSYIEAIKYLGEKYGVEIVEKETDNTLSSERDSLLILLNKSKDFFVENLNTDEGKNIALTYFEFRKVSDLMIKKFELGYSLDAWNSLNDHLKGLKYSEELMLSAGLILEKNNKKYDRFRNRIIFPIHNISGKVIAFGARQIKNDEKQPKYINSPETVLYIKSNILYGIYQSKNIIRKEDKCYLVEGYTDVISLFQIGIENVVSSSGTSLTTNQIKLISRYTKNITILYDGDQAGINASLRGMDLILENDLNVRIISFPKNEDPDSYSKKLGKKEFLKFLNDNETDLIKFKTDQLSDNYKDDSIKKSELVIDVIRSISKIPNSIKRSIYIKDCSNVLKIDENILITEMNKLLIGSRHTSSPTKFYFKEEKKKDSSPKELDGAIDFYEKECLRMLVNYGTIDFQVFGLNRKSFIEYFLNEIEDVEFENKNYIKIIDVFKVELEKGNVIDIKYFLNQDYEDLKTDIIDLSASKYELSDKWKNKYNIHVSDESDDLKKSTYSNILRFKFRLIKKMINENLQILNSNIDFEKQQETIKIHNKLKSAEMEIAKELGNVTSI